MRLRFLGLSLALLLGCSDFDCPNGQQRIEGTCVDPNDGIAAPEAKAKGLPMVCNDNVGLPTEVFPNQYWELHVDPGPIQSGEEFGASFKAVAIFPDYFVNTAQLNLPGGVSRVELLALQATVHVRRGTGDLEPSDVTLEFEDFPRTCRYDDEGRIGAQAGPFPTCAPQNDNSDGSNEDCTGLGGAPQPENRCGHFVDIPISFDCAPGGECDRLDTPFEVRRQSCDRNGFCATDLVEVPLVGSKDGYVAAESGKVVFGFDDQSTGAELDQTGGPNHGTWVFPPPAFDDELGPNSMRLRGGEDDFEYALECIMAVDSNGPFAREHTRDTRPSPVPDHMLISFPIQEL